jgi:hypothetical protein
MYPKSVRIEEAHMLELRPIGQCGMRSTLVEQVLRQAEAIGRYPEAARALVQASFEYMLSGPRWRRSGKHVVLESHPMGLRISDWLIHVLPDVSDDSLRALAQIGRFNLAVDVVAPPWATLVAKEAVRTMELKCPVTVYSIDCYVELRMIWTGLDLDHGPEHKEAELLARYRTLIRTMPAIDVG